MAEELKTRDMHYRSYVGPPERYDLISAMVFNLMTCLGLREHHTVIDVGCGSLRNGRLLIPYLNPENYIGVEPNKWLVDAGIKNETGKDIINIKKPTFIYNDNLNSIDCVADFVLAQSIFSHTGLNLFDNWLASISSRLHNNGILLATVVEGVDYKGEGWVYPGCVTYRKDTIKSLAKNNNFEFTSLNFKHPAQQWVAFYKEGFCEDLLQNDITWNMLISSIYSI